MAKTELFEKPPAKEAAVEVKDEKPNGDFERLMDKDVSLNPEIQKVITAENGRCDKLDPQQKEEYSGWICTVMGVSPALRPVDFIPTKNGIRPYLNKGAAELIRDARKISITSIEVTEQNGMFVVMCHVKDVSGRVDVDLGVCMKGDEPNNALMKAVTKAKRRATLSMCRLGGIIEEAHPTEYNGNGIEEQPKSSVLLQEDENEAKRVFRDVVLSKIDAEALPDEVWTKLIEQTKRLADTQSYAEAGRWIQEKGRISLNKDDEGVVVKATIKEEKNGKSKE
jgi:hypothetical protein